MPSATLLRAQIERFLERRIPAALSPAPRTFRETASTGIEEMDALLNGGLPVGAISELTGPASSGRTSLALAFLAQRTAEGRVCAWVDVDDTLDPASAAASGIALPQLLWVRCGGLSPRRPYGTREADCHSPSATLKRGANEYCASGAVVETLPDTKAQPKSFSAASSAPEESLYQRKNSSRVWTRLDQALRATDLLLQAGGFAAIVLDLGDTAREHASHIPLATWFRYRQAVDRSRASLVVLGQAAYAQSSSAVVLECAPLQAQSAGGTVLRGFSAQIHRGRERFAPVEIRTKKPPASTWTAGAQWERAAALEEREGCA
jgi:recombination protein RecA